MRFDEIPAVGAVEDDIGVVFDVCARRHFARQIGDIGRPARFFEAAVFRQLIDNGERVAFDILL